MRLHQPFDVSSSHHVCAILLLLLTYMREGVCARHSSDFSGRVPMGVSNVKCDDAKTNLTIDGDYQKPGFEAMYECLEGKTFPVSNMPPVQEDQEMYDAPWHTCMNTTITYEENPPLSGEHRPLWPVYGEYIYLPPQRWLHSMEHGAVVLLYHPCADPDELTKMKSLVRGCLRRHVITPYIFLPETRPFALLVWQHKLSLSFADTLLVEDFIKTYAITSGLEKIYQDGQYDYGIIEQAQIVSNKRDSRLCPNS